MFNTVDDKMSPQLNEFNELLKDNNFNIKKNMQSNSLSKKQYNFSINSLSKSSLTTLSDVSTLNLKNLKKNSLPAISDSTFNQESLNPLFLVTSQFQTTLFPTPPISVHSSTESVNQFSPNFMNTSINQENLLSSSKNGNSKSCENIALQNITNENFNSFKEQPMIQDNLENIKVFDEKDESLLANKNINDALMSDRERALSLKLKLRNFAKIKKSDSLKHQPITTFFSPILTKDRCRKIVKLKNDFIEINKKNFLSKSYKNEFASKIKIDFDKKKSKKRKLTLQNNYKLKNKNFCLQTNKESNSHYSEIILKRKLIDQGSIDEINKIFFCSIDVQNNSGKSNLSKNTLFNNNWDNCDIKLSDFNSSFTIKSNWHPISDGFYKQVQCFNNVKSTQQLCFKEIRHCSQHNEVIRVNDCVRIFLFDGRENFGKVLHLFYDNKKSKKFLLNKK